MAAPVFLAGYPLDLHTPATGIRQRGGFRAAVITPHDADGGKALLGADCRQRMQVIGPGPAERDESIDALAPGLVQVGAELELFITRGEPAAPIQAQQGDITHGHAGDRRIAESGQHRGGGGGERIQGRDRPTLFFCSTCSAR